MVLDGGPGEIVLQSGPQKAEEAPGMRYPRHLLPRNLTLTRSPNLHSELSLPSHLPFYFLGNLLNSQFIVLSQELQLLVDESQPVLPLFSHLQTVNPESKEHFSETYVPT